MLGTIKNFPIHNKHSFCVVSGDKFLHFVGKDDCKIVSVHQFAVDIQNFSHLFFLYEKCYDTYMVFLEILYHLICVLLCVALLCVMSLVILR